MYEKSLCKVWIYRNENCWSYNLHKPDTPYAFRMKKCLSPTPVKKWENIYEMCTKQEVHIFNMWTAIMQILYKRNENFWSYRLYKLGTQKVLR